MSYTNIEEVKRSSYSPRNVHRTSSLGPSLIFKGTLSGHEDLTIHGQFTGTIKLNNHDLIVETEGKVEAEIQAKNIIIRGEVKGNIVATGKVFIDENAQMVGDISAARISIMEGAQFKGRIKLTS